MEKLRTYLVGRGFEQEDTNNYVLKLRNGIIRVFIDREYAVRVDKPNRTHKWLYDKSYAQYVRAIEQTLDWNRSLFA